MAVRCTLLVAADNPSCVDVLSAILWPVAIVRRAVTADWQQSRPIRLQALQDAPLAFASTHDQEVRFPPTQWQQRIVTAAQFLAEVDGAVVGTVTGVVDAGDPTTMLLVAMFVVPNSRGRGIDEQLVKAVIEQARLKVRGRSGYTWLKPTVAASGSMPDAAS